MFGPFFCSGKYRTQRRLSWAKLHPRRWSRQANGTARTCIDALRVLARSSDGDRAVLVERYIDAYLTTETVSVWHAVERLGKAIHDEHAKRRQGEDWSLAKDYVRSVLHRMT
jgi:hypothetical protein